MKIKKILKISIISILIIALSFVLFLIINLSPVSSDEKTIDFTINSGDSKMDIVDNLYEAGVIKSSLALKFYLLLDYSDDFYAGDYTFLTNESAIKILSQIQNGEYLIETKETISVVFVEGKRLTEYATVIAENFGYEYNEVIEVLNDREFLEELVSKYTYVTDEILDEDLYYPLEGYLYPDTYEFYPDASIEEIVEKMISQLENKISSEYLAVDESDYTVHEILTMASIVELEAMYSSDRYYVAQVIYNRLNSGMTLGMDVTTYYGSQIDMGEELTYTELYDVNPYNTRASGFYGLPAGAICSPSIESILAVIYPAEGDYLYFYADLDDGEVNFFYDYTAFYEYAYGN